MGTGVGSCNLGGMREWIQAGALWKGAIEKAPWAVHTANHGANAPPSWVIKSLRS